MFVDASALVAILTDEPDAELLEERLGRSNPRLTSAVGVYETVLAVGRKFGWDLAAAEASVQRFLAESSITIVLIGPEEARAALDAHARFGKGRHPAQLNMGDCFAYACARTHGVPLLYKGGDFSLTDVATA